MKIPPTFGEQTEVIKDWWAEVREMYIQLLISSQSKELANKDDKKNQKDFSNL